MSFFLYRPPSAILRLLIIVLLVSTSVICGCRKSDTDQLAISGRVTLGEEPLEGGSISFESVGLQGNSANGRIVEGQFTIPGDLGPPPGEYLVKIFYFAKTGRMIEDTDAPGQKVAETRQVVPAKYNHRSTLKIVLDADHAESVDFNLDAR